MASQDYSHKTIVLKCSIESNTVKKDKKKIRLPSTNDWNKNLKSILSRVPKSFKFLSEMDETQWSISINGTIIDKTNSAQFGRMLSSIPPIPVVEIVKKSIDEDSYIIAVHYDDKQFDYVVKGTMDDWDDDTYFDLVASIRKEFNLDSNIVLYEQHLSGDRLYLDDMDDIISGFKDELDDETNGTAGKQKMLHIFVQVTLTFLFPMLFRLKLV